jgi:hypothetical protein
MFRGLSTEGLHSIRLQHTGATSCRHPALADGTAEQHTTSTRAYAVPSAVDADRRCVRAWQRG